MRLFRHPAWSGLTTYDTLTLANAGSNDTFLCNYTDTGRLLWAARIAGTASEQGNGVSVDSLGNVYTAGTYASGPLTIYNADGSTFGTLSNAGSTDVFVVKYNSTGTAQWAARLAGTVDEYGNSIAVDSSGNVYVTGSYASNPLTIYNANGTAFGTTLSNAGSYDVFVVKYNTSGTAQWATRIAGSGSDTGRGISVDSSGNVYATGQFQSAPVTIYHAGGGTFGTLTNSGSGDVFIVKYNTGGTAQWATRVAGISFEQGNAITTDSSGNVYVAGQYASDPLTIYHAGGGTFGTLTNSGASADVFIVKYNTSGTAEWATRVAGTTNEFGYGISVDSFGNAYVTGQFASDPLTIYHAGGGTFGTLSTTTTNVFIVKYNTGGTAQWATKIGGTGIGVGTNQGFSISADTSGNVYVTGSYSSDPLNIYNADGGTFGSLSTIGSTDVFVVKYNTSGTAQWATRSGGTGAEVGYGVSATATSVAVCGIYASNPLTLRSVGF